MRSHFYLTLLFAVHVASFTIAATPDGESNQIMKIPPDELITSEYLLEQDGFPVPKEFGAAAIIPERRLARYNPMLLPPPPQSLAKSHGDAVLGTRAPHEILQGALQDITRHVPLLKARDEAITQWLQIWQTRRSGILYHLSFKSQDMQHQVYGAVGEFLTISVVLEDQPENLPLVLSNLLRPEDRERVQEWLDKQEIEKGNEDYLLESDNLVVRFGWRRQSREGLPAVAKTFFGLRVVYLFETENKKREVLRELQGGAATEEPPTTQPTDTGEN